MKADSALRRPIDAPSPVKIPWSAPPRDVLLMVGAGLTLLVALVFVPRVWAATLLPLAAVGLALTGVAASRWPRATLVVACLATLSDPILAPRALPPNVDLGPIGASEPMLGVTALVVGITALRRGTFLAAFRDPVLPLGVTFVLVAIASAVVNAVPAQVAALGILMTVDAIAIYFVARMVRFDDRSASLAVTALVVAAVLAATLGLLQAILDPDLLGLSSFRGRSGEGWRITGYVGNPNMLAMIVGLAMPFAVYGASRAGSARLRRMSMLAVFLLAAALLLTLSRGGWIAIALGVTIGGLLLNRRAAAILALLVALAAVSVSVMPRYMLLSPEEYARAVGAGGAPPSLIDTTLNRLDQVGQQRDLRMRFIREGLPIVRDHPWLGVGPGRYGGAAAAITASPVYEDYETGLYGFRTVHNFWLHLLGEVGVIGTLVFVLLVLVLGVRLGWAARALRIRAGPGHRSARFIVLAGSATMLLTVSIHSGTEMAFEGNIPAVLVWFYAGMASTLLSQDARPAAEAPRDGGAAAVEPS